MWAPARQHLLNCIGHMVHRNKIITSGYRVGDFRRSWQQQGWVAQEGQPLAHAHTGGKAKGFVVWVWLGRQWKVEGNWRRAIGEPVLDRGRVDRKWKLGGWTWPGSNSPQPLLSSNSLLQWRRERAPGIRNFFFVSTTPSRVIQHWSFVTGCKNASILVYNCC